MWILFAVTIAADACQADPGGLWQGPAGTSVMWDAVGRAVYTPVDL